MDLFISVYGFNFNQLLIVTVDLILWVLKFAKGEGVGEVRNMENMTQNSFFVPMFYVLVRNSGILIFVNLFWS